MTKQEFLIFKIELIHAMDGVYIMDEAETKLYLSELSKWQRFKWHVLNFAAHCARSGLADSLLCGWRIR